MERKIGEIFEYNDGWYQCIVGNGCENCAFNERKCYAVVDNGDPIGDCCADRRKDDKDVIFKKLEKVGEPFFVNIQGDNVLEQRYKLYEPMVTLKEYWYRIDGNFINIEIKQNKEDMEENYKAEDTLLTRLVGRYVNNLIDYETFEKAVKELYSDKKDSKPILKEFDLKAAKAGKPVCTRDGRRARIICFDMNSFNNHIIVALITEENGTESIYSYTSEGKWKETKTENDLMMLPEKKEGLVNVYKDSVYDTKYEALIRRSRSESRGYIDTIKISWEE